MDNPLSIHRVLPFVATLVHSWPRNTSRPEAAAGGWSPPIATKFPRRCVVSPSQFIGFFFFFVYFSLVSFDNPSDRLAQGPWTVPWADGASEGVVQWLQRLLSNEPHQRLCVELADEPKLAHNLTTFACCTGQ